MKWIQQPSKRLLGFTVISGEKILAAVYHSQGDGNATLMAKAEFDASQISPAERKKAFHAFVSRLGRVSFKHILLRDKTFSKQFRFPTRNPNEIKQMLALRLPREIPSAIDEIVYHFHAIQDTSENSFQTNVLLFGASKDIVNQERDLLKSFGLSPQHILLSTMVLWNYAERKLETKTGLPKVVVFGAEGKGEVVLVGDLGVQFSRSFTYDSKEPVHSMQDALLPIFEYLEKKEKVEAYDFCVSGDVDKVKSELFAGEQNSISLHPEGKELLPLEFLLYAGACVYREELDRFNLLPEDAKRRIEVARSQSHLADLRIAALEALAVFVLVCVFLTIRMAIAQGVISRKVADLEPSVREIKESVRAAQILQTIKTQKIRPIDLFAQIHEKAPGGISLSEAEYDEREGFLRLKGRTDTQALVNQYVRELEKIDWLSKVELQYSESTSDGIRSQFQFAINAVLKGGTER